MSPSSRWEPLGGRRPRDEALIRSVLEQADADANAHAVTAEQLLADAGIDIMPARRAQSATEPTDGHTLGSGPSRVLQGQERGVAERSSKVAPRLEADRSLVSVIQQKGPESREHSHLEQDLKDIVAGTLINLSKNDRLFHEVRRQCALQLPEPPADWLPYNARRVIYLSAEVGTRRFMKKQIMEGRWDPAKGASIRTCCVRAGLYAFADEYRTYHKEEVRRYHTDETQSSGLSSDEVDVRLLEPVSNLSVDPAVTAEQRDRIARALAHASQQIVTIVHLDADGWTHKQIGKELGIDATQVGYELRKFRSDQGRG